MMLLQTGDQVDRYQVEHFVGRGGLAEVYAVRHRVLETRHALKVLKRAHPEQVERLILEGRVQARIDHPNIVPVRDVFDVGASPALLMPLVDGPALLQVLETRPLTVDEAGALLREIVAGVGHIHSHDLVHRDIKPGNVLLEVRGRRIVPRVSDFGLVKEVRLDMRQTVAGGFLGTPAYAAPEQLQAKQDIDSRADIWSLGVLLFEMLTGELPFNERGLLSLASEETMVFAPPPPRPTGLSDGWYALLCDLLSTARERRLASASEVQARLDELMVPVAGEAAALQLNSPLGATVLTIRQEMVARRPAAPALSPAAAPTLAPLSQDAVARPTQTAPGARDNLPRTLDRFVGRTHELRDLHELLGTERLVTITGAAGTGKTRLSIELGDRVARDRVGDVCFVSIEACASEESIARAVASALELPMTRDSQVAVVERELDARGVTLLILDNAEQAVRPTAQLCDRWLGALQELRIVVTSRMPIDLAGETVFALAPLGLPNERSLGEAATLLETRARQHAPHFTLEAQSLEDVRAVVEALDGLPLAIELAAARLRTMSLPMLRERLSSRFTLLSAPLRGRVSAKRRASLRSAIDSSWELLADWEKHALAQISVFVGEATLTDLEQVVDLTAWDEHPLVMDAVASLVDQSLLQVVRPNDGAQDTAEPRYRLLVSIRDYASEKLSREGELATSDGRAMSGHDARIAAETRHGQRMARWLMATPDGQPIRGELEGREIIAALSDLERACERALERGDDRIAAMTANTVGQATMIRGPLQRGIRLLTRVAELIADEGHRARVLCVVGGLQIVGEHPDATKTLSLAAELGETNNLPRVAARAIRSLAYRHCDQGEIAEAAACAARAETLFDGPVPLDERARLELLNAIVGIHEYRYDEAEANLVEAERLASISNDPGLVGVVLSWRHVVYMKQGRHEQSLAVLNRAIEFAMAEGNLFNHSRYLRALGLHERLVGDPVKAKAHLQHSLAIEKTLGLPYTTATLLHCAMASAQAGNYAEALAFLEENGIAEATPLNMAWFARGSAAWAMLCAHAGDREGYERRVAQANSAADGFDKPPVYAQVAAYAGLGLLALGDTDAAAEQLRVAQSRAAEVNVHPYSVEGHEIRWLERELARAQGVEPPQHPGPVTAANQAITKRPE